MASPLNVKDIKSEIEYRAYEAKMWYSAWADSGLWLSSMDPKDAETVRGLDHAMGVSMKAIK